MPHTKRAQVLMDPAEYRKLEKIARQKGVSVAELIRVTVRERYLLTDDRRREAVEDILAMSIPAEDWGKTEEEIEEAHVADLP